MSTCGFVALAVLVVFVILWQVGKRPYRHRGVSQDGLLKYFSVLLKRGYNGGNMTIETSRRGLFLQFAKYIDAVGVAGLQFDFPHAPWSRQYYPILAAELREAGFEFEVQEVSGGDVSEFLVVDLHKDLEKAQDLVRLSLQRVFGLAPDEAVVLFFRQVSPRDETIGR